MLVIAATLAFSAAAWANPFQGKTFKVQLGEVGKKQDPDKLIFSKGQFVSQGCTQWGFGSATYKARKAGSSWTFTAHAKSAKEGDSHWKGTLSGSTFKGTMRWVKKGQKAITYAFSGKTGR